MDASTSISQMLSGNTIFVPAYQRAYAWDIEQVSQFIVDLQDYISSRSSSKYYFGHFLFEYKGNKNYAIIDGQQRLTTITIFISALYARIKCCRQLSEEELFTYGAMIKVGQTYRFSTVDYDSQLFKDYVVNKIKTDTNGLTTESQKRIVAAYDYFCRIMSDMDEAMLSELMSAVVNASCTTHTVNDEAEAIQMFIFQNNRGKKPSDLEIIKAQFLYNIHLYASDEAEKHELVSEIKNRFEEVYKYVSIIEDKVKEDDVLIYTLRVFFNSLGEKNAVQKIYSELEKDTRIVFIRDFTHSLVMSFEFIAAFLEKEKYDFDIHVLYVVSVPALMMPFIVKAYKYNVPEADFKRLAKAMVSIFMRNRVVGTRAILTWRLSEVFQNFAGDVQPIIDRIEWMKVQDGGFWGYWNNTEFNRALHGWLNRDVIKMILWEYENHLIEEGKPGYPLLRYDAVIKPQLEHIAPQTENPESGYCKYDEDFQQSYLDSLGNYLLLSAQHNISIGNIPFEDKRKTYTQLLQQQEVRDMTETDRTWDKEKIAIRKDKIIKFVVDTF